ncbi:CPBP family intramembrane glutamic endopeptidase [Halorhabdus sp. CBA1104]|uniref:CPBP family intramembrane glutamic endopeptidase n=2 Tax=unclassified Halorhabdus TaxID=2621901 RepID=UPI0012B2EEC1|nr:CPBP family glutamic-type intramembrane protease [Halorhabdus sp. CBA1104]
MTRHTQRVVAAATDEPDSTDEMARSLSTPAVLANVALTQALLAGVVLAGVWYVAVPASVLGLAKIPPSVSTVLIGVAFGTVLWLASETATTLSTALGVEPDERLRGLLAPATAGGWLAVLVVVLPLVAISEELLFRAGAIGASAAGLGLSPWVLAVPASIAFGCCHAIQGRTGVVVTGGLGFVLASGYVITDNLVVVIVAHYVLDGIELLVHEWLDSTASVD